MALLSANAGRAATAKVKPQAVCPWDASLHGQLSQNMGRAGDEKDFVKNTLLTTYNICVTEQKRSEF
jgi:hypothetical protein